MPAPSPLGLFTAEPRLKLSVLLAPDSDTLRGSRTLRGHRVDLVPFADEPSCPMAPGNGRNYPDRPPHCALGTP